jgi:hypothetical protein
MIFNAIVCLLMLLTFAVQEFIPAIEMAQYATLFLPVVFFLAASVAVPFPVMLMLAFATGLIWDARHLPAIPVAEQSMALAAVDFSGATYDAASLKSTDLGFGLSVVFFGLLGSIMQGVRPLFKRGRLELPVLMVGVSVAGWLLMQYLLMAFLRGNVFFNSAVWTKLITATLLAMLASPVIFLILHLLARLTEYEIKYEGLRLHHHGR